MFVDGQPSQFQHVHAVQIAVNVTENHSIWHGIHIATNAHPELFPVHNSRPVFSGRFAHSFVRIDFMNGFPWGDSLTWAIQSIESDWNPIKWLHFKWIENKPNFIRNILANVHSSFTLHSETNTQTINVHYKWNRWVFHEISADFFFAPLSLSWFSCIHKICGQEGKKTLAGHHLSCFCANSLCFLSNYLSFVALDLNALRIPAVAVHTSQWRFRKNFGNVSNASKRERESERTTTNGMCSNLNKHIFDGHWKTVHN